MQVEQRSLAYGLESSKRGKLRADDSVENSGLFPWSFTGVETSQPMVAAAEHRIHQAGLGGRVRLLIDGFFAIKRKNGDQL
ncbi:hypothetical protein [Paenibacillus luteus]|uniref:hypothetical protein n=1 Tax=Paenibacillus luteus TaxID=2545753 RepID=UPI0011418009|nr:hypothetical protein [Paenibacillus luteus]